MKEQYEWNSQPILVTQRTPSQWRVLCGCSTSLTFEKNEEELNALIQQYLINTTLKDGYDFNHFFLTSWSEKFQENVQKIRLLKAGDDIKLLERLRISLAKNSCIVHVVVAGSYLFRSISRGESASARCPLSFTGRRALANGKQNVLGSQIAKGVKLQALHIKEPFGSSQHHSIVHQWNEQDIDAKYSRSHWFLRWFFLAIYFGLVVCY